MIYSSKGIVLSYIKYSETSVIVTIYTERAGKLAFIINGIRKPGKKRGGQMALLQPFTLLDLQMYFKEKSHIQRLKEFTLDVPLRTIPYAVHKRSIALFLAEILMKTLRGEEQDAALFHFLHHAIQVIDLEENAPDIHLVFLMQLSKYLGFFPRNNHGTHRPLFDLRRGYFVEDPPGHQEYLNSAQSKLFARIIQTDFSNTAQAGFTNTNRSEMLDALMDYYKLHVEGMGKIQSLEVMRALYH